MSDDAVIEGMIQERGLVAPRLRPNDIDEQIVSAQYHVFPGTTTTVCCLSLVNGYTVVGTSACASPENFDREMGELIARRNAREQIWALEGYALRERIASAEFRARIDAAA